MHPQFEDLTPQWFFRAFIYSGSIGEFRYRFSRDKDAKIIHTSVYSHFCYEAARDTVEQDFPRTEEGVAALRQWLQAQLDTFHAEGRFLPAEKSEEPSDQEGSRKP